MYRLYIDIPVGTNEENAIYKSNLLIQEFLSSHRNSIEHLNEKYDIDKVSWRLGHDEDRQKSNYLQKTPDGHVTKKKNVVQTSVK